MDINSALLSSQKKEPQTFIKDVVDNVAEGVKDFGTDWLDEDSLSDRIVHLVGALLDTPQIKSWYVEDEIFNPVVEGLKQKGIEVKKVP